MDDEYFLDVQTIIKEDETGGPARLVLVVRGFLTVTWRVTFAIGSWLGSLAMNLKRVA